MSNNAIIALIIVAIIIVGGYFLYENYAGDDMDMSPAGTVEEGTEGGSATETGPSGINDDDEAPLKTFTVTSKPFSFTPATITVNRGDRVKIIFKNESGTHDWVIDEFDARTPIIGGGKEATVEFIADKAGIFEYYCSVGSHRAMGMVGKLIVK